MWRLLLSLTLSVPLVVAASDDAGVTARPALDLRQLSLDAAGIRVVVGHHLPALRGCYGLALADGGRAEGVVRVNFTVSPDGKVEQASVVELGIGPRLPEVRRCLEQQLQQMEFPRPTDGEPQPVEMPLILKAVE